MQRKSSRQHTSGKTYPLLIVRVNVEVTPEVTWINHLPRPLVSSVGWVDWFRLLRLLFSFFYNSSNLLFSYFSNKQSITFKSMTALPVFLLR